MPTKRKQIIGVHTWQQKNNVHPKQDITVLQWAIWG